MSSSNTSIATAANDIKRLTTTFSLWWSVVLCILGHSLSIYVFTRRTLRSNSCARYFLASTIVSCGIVYCTLPLRVLQTGFYIDVFIYSVAGCKIISYFLSCVKILPCWFIFLASADRFLCRSSSATLCAWSNIRVASRIIPITILFVGLAYSHVLRYYNIQLPSKACGADPGTYQIVLGFCNLFVWSWIPSVGMLVCGLLTIRHVRQGKRRLAPQNTENHLQQTHRKTDRQLMQMMFVQSFTLCLTTIGQPINALYKALSINTQENALDLAKDNLIANMLAFISLTGPCISFYLFILSSQFFRHELAHLCHCRPRAHIGDTGNITGRHRN